MIFVCPAQLPTMLHPFWILMVKVSVLVEVGSGIEVELGNSKVAWSCVGGCISTYLVGKIYLV